jgi:pyridoxal phosphate enzyme (YggS family)
MVNLKIYDEILSMLKPYDATMVAVSKLKPVEDILALLDHGQKIFGENYVQELTEKNLVIRNAEWHFIGHLQSNKVKFIAPFIRLIHGVDSMELLKEIDKQAKKSKRIIDCLLQIHIAKEETKFGLSFQEANELLNSSQLQSLKNVSIRGMMGMATATEEESIIRSEFQTLRSFFDKFRSITFSILSMGMTMDYKIALEEGSTMIRIGSAIFGERNDTLRN